MADRLHELIEESTVTRDEALARLARRSTRRRPIIGAGAGTGLSAKLAEAGGADLIIIYNSGRYRMGGRGSLAGMMPYGDANAIVIDMAREVLPVVGTRRAGRRLRHRPVSGHAAVPRGAPADRLQRRPELPDGRPDRRHVSGGLEETGMGFGLEVDMIRLAHELDLLTAPYVFNDDEATAMAEAGATCSFRTWA